jgi:predicted GH43/DUF377 family glycosyl hydrolase
MLEVKREGLILKPTKLDFENRGVINPACIQHGKHVHMYYRAWNKENRSVIGYCKLEGPLKVVERWTKPILYPESPKEFNLEDPRITLIDGIYYMVYVAYDGKNVRLAYATSKDLIHWHKKGIISPEITYDEAEDLFRACKTKLKERYFLFEAYFKDRVGEDAILWDKDAFLFPKKIKGKYALIHRILPDIQVIYFKDFKDLTLNYWKKYFKVLNKYVVLESQHWFESRNIGGGCPPIETDYGWLMIYHAVDDMDRGKIYRAGAALLDKKDPTKVIGHLEEPLLSPKEKWEKNGNISNVIFPTGHAIFKNRLYVYYGASDKYIGAFSVRMNDLLSELLKNGKKKHF